MSVHLSASVPSPAQPAYNRSILEIFIATRIHMFQYCNLFLGRKVLVWVAARIHMFQYCNLFLGRKVYVWVAARIHMFQYCNLFLGRKVIGMGCHVWYKRDRQQECVIIMILTILKTCLNHAMLYSWIWTEPSVGLHGFDLQTYTLAKTCIYRVRVLANGLQCLVGSGVLLATTIMSWRRL